MNRPLITAGAPQDPNLPVDRMTEPELREMQQILTTHGAVGNNSRCWSSDCRCSF